MSWDVKAAPVFDLTPSVYSEAALRAQLTEGRAGQFTEAELTEHVGALRDSLEGSTFQVRLSLVHVKVDSGDGNPVEEDIAVTVQVQATTSETGLFSLNPFKATADAPRKVDKIFLDKVVLPNVLDQSRKVLSGITLPTPQIPGLSLSTPVPVIQPQWAVAALNLSEHGIPKPPFPDSWPQSPFFALLGRDAVERIAQVATAYLEGKTFPTGDHKDFLGSSAYYKADISIHSVRCEVVWGDVPTVRVHTSVSGSGSSRHQVGLGQFDRRVLRPPPGARSHRHAEPGDVGDHAQGHGRGCEFLRPQARAHAWRHRQHDRLVGRRRPVVDVRGPGRQRTARRRVRGGYIPGHPRRHRSRPS